MQAVEESLNILVSSSALENIASCQDVDTWARDWLGRWTAGCSEKSKGVHGLAISGFVGSWFWFCCEATAQSTTFSLDPGNSHMNAFQLDEFVSLQQNAISGAEKGHSEILDDIQGLFTISHSISTFIRCDSSNWRSASAGGSSWGRCLASTKTYELTYLSQRDLMFCLIAQ